MIHYFATHPITAMVCTGRDVMRSIILATAIVAVGLFTATPSNAQAQQKASMQQAFNACVDLARQRGWTESDLEISGREVRNFVARCIQGRQARAQKAKR